MGKKRDFARKGVSPLWAHRLNTWSITVQILGFLSFFQEQKELVDPYLTFNFAGRKVSVSLSLKPSKRAEQKVSQFASCFLIILLFECEARVL